MFSSILIFILLFNFPCISCYLNHHRCMAEIGVFRKGAYWWIRGLAVLPILDHTLWWYPAVTGAIYMSFNNCHNQKIYIYIRLYRRWYALSIETEKVQHFDKIRKEKNYLRYPTKNMYGLAIIHYQKKWQQKYCIKERSRVDLALKVFYAS